VKWSGDIDDNAAYNTTVYIVMDRDRTITADFTGCYDITVNASTYLRGSTTVNASFGIVICNATKTSAGTIVNITAIAAEGYRFVEWSGNIGDNAANDSSISVVMDDYRDITAIFNNSEDSSAGPSFQWGWAVGGVAAFLLIVLLIVKFMSGRAKKPDDFLTPM